MLQRMTSGTNEFESRPRNTRIARKIKGISDEDVGFPGLFLFVCFVVNSVRKNCAAYSQFEASLPDRGSDGSAGPFCGATRRSISRFGPDQRIERQRCNSVACHQVISAE